MENRVPTVFTCDHQLRAVRSSLAPANIDLSFLSGPASGKTGRFHLLTGQSNVPDLIHMADITSLELSVFDSCSSLRRILAQALGYNRGTLSLVHAEIAQQLLRRAQLAFRYWPNATSHPLVSVTCHCQTLVDDDDTTPDRCAINCNVFQALTCRTDVAAQLPAIAFCLRCIFQVCCCSYKSLCW